MKSIITIILFHLLIASAELYLLISHSMLLSFPNYLEEKYMVPSFPPDPLLSPKAPLLTKEDLFIYCNQNWSGIIKENQGNPGRGAKQATELGFEVYKRAASRVLDFTIIGPNRLREDRDLCSNVGQVLGNLSKRAIKEIRNTPELLYTAEGAILGEKQWSGLINDLFMLGAVHAKKTFHFSIPAGRELTNQDVWDTKKQKLTTTGRELLLLKLAGYQKITDGGKAMTTIFGHVFVPHAEERHCPISLEKYRVAIKECKGPDEILTLFGRTVRWDQYFAPCFEQGEVKTPVPSSSC